MDGADTRLTKILGWTAALAFAASWFLPVLKDVPGWMAFRYALASVVPYQGLGGDDWQDSAPQVLSALTNFAFIILFGLWQLKRPVRPSLFVRIAIACFILNMYWFVTAWRDHDVKSLLVGYYVWVAAFGLLLAVASLIAFASRRTSKTPTAATPS